MISYSDIVQLLIHCTFPVTPPLGMGCCLFLEHILDDTPRWSHLLTELYSSTCGTAANCATVTTSITLDAIPLANLAPVHNQGNDGTHEPTDETEQSWAWLHVLRLVVQITWIAVQGVAAVNIHRIEAVTQPMLPFTTRCCFVCHLVCLIIPRSDIL